MTVLDVEGWEGLNTAQAASFWVLNTGTFAVGVTGRRSSNGGTLSSGGTITRALSAAQTLLRCEMAVNLGGLNAGPIIAFMDGASFQCELRVTGTGHLQVTRNGTVLATGTDLPLIPGTWFHVGFEVSFSNTVGSVEVRVFNQPVTGLTLTNQDTVNTANVSANGVRIQSQSAVSAIICDDIVISNDAGSAPHNDFLGNCRIDYMAPDGAGNYTQGAPSAGSNFQCVDENPANDDTDYVSFDTGEKDTYTMTTPSGSGSVFAVAPQFRVRIDDAGAATVRPIARRAGVDGNGSNVSPGDLYVTHRQVWQTDPTDASAWDGTKVAALEIGLERTV